MNVNAALDLLVAGSNARSFRAELLSWDDGLLEDRLQEQAQRSHHTHDHEDPQEQTIHHHSHVLPVPQSPAITQQK